MQFEVKNRWTGAVQFTAEIEANEDAPLSIKLGLAVKWAIESRAYLSGADLSDAYLRGAHLSRAYLSGADLSDADLSRAYLSGADLSGANLSGADLSDADLSRAYLSGANLSGANLSGADLSDADLSRAYLSGANLSGADLSRAYLSGAKNVHDFTMPDGIKFSTYLKEVVPALLTAGGKTVEQIVQSGAWECHSWDNCPMAVAFDVHDVESVPPLYRARAQEFVRFFDANLIPCPATEGQDTQAA